MMDKKDKVLWTVSIGFMLLAIAAFVITDTQRNAVLSAQQTEIATLEQQKKEASDKRTSEVNTVTKNSFGVDTSRVATDDRIATEMLIVTTQHELSFAMTISLPMIARCYPHLCLRLKMLLLDKMVR